MPTLARIAPLLFGIQLFLDVLRGPLPAHAASGGLCERGQNFEMVLPARLAKSSSNNGRLRLQSLLRRVLHPLVRYSPVITSAFKTTPFSERLDTIWRSC